MPNMCISKQDQTIANQMITQKGKISQINKMTMTKMELIPMTEFSRKYASFLRLKSHPYL